MIPSPLPTVLIDIVNHLWQTTVFAGMAALLTLALRNNRAQVRYCLWLAASVKFLIPFSMLVMVGSHFARHAAPAAAASYNFSFLIEEVNEPFAGTARFATVPPAGLSPASLILPVLGVVWAIGFVIIISSWWVRWRQMRGVLRLASPLPLPIGVKVMSSPAFIEPGVFGIRRPVLLLPESITGQLTTAQLKTVLAHELCHIRRRDNLATAIHMVVEAVFWFHPLVWWLGARLMEERESACDEEVLRIGAEPEVYAEGILKICELYLESPWACVAGVTGANLKTRIEAIMTNRKRQGMSAGKKLLLGAAGVLAVSGPVVIGLMDTRPIRAQAQAPEHYTFETTSVKPHKTGDRQYAFPQMLPGGRFTARAPLFVVIAVAYDLPIQGAPRISGGPSWINSEESVYDIEATPPKGAFPDGISDIDRTDRERSMLQALLADRFKLVVHRETKEMAVYALVVGKGGPKLDKADIEEKDCPATTDRTADGTVVCHKFNGGRGRGLHGRAVDMADLVAFVGNWTDRPLLDKTGIKGLYKIETQPFLPMELTTNPPPPGTKQDGVDVSDLPTLYMLFERLGLKMETQRGQVGLVVIDHIDKPTEN